MNYSIMYVMTQTRKAFVNGVIHSKPSQSFVSQCRGRSTSICVPSCRGASPYCQHQPSLIGGFFWYLSVETAVVLFSSANQSRNRKRKRKTPEPVATVSMISPIYHSFSSFFASPDPTVLFATFLPDIFMSRSGYISKSSVKIFCCLKCSFLADTFSSGTFRVQRTSVTGVLFSDTDSTKTVTQSSRSCFQYRQ